MTNSINMLRDLLIGGAIGSVLGGWQVLKQGSYRQPEFLTGQPPTLKQQEQQIADLQQQLTQVQQELAVALANQAEAETQCAELNQLATDRAIELIQLQADQAELIAKVAELSQKRTRKKRSPKSSEVPPEAISTALTNGATKNNGEADNGAAYEAVENGAVENGEVVLDAAMPFALNLALVQEKQLESSAATQLLQSVFAEEGGPIQQTGSGLTTDVLGIGLDTAHAHFLQTLAQQSSWSREALLEVSGRLDLLLDGALEIINEVAFDRCDEPLTDGENPIEVNARVLQELLS